MDLNSEFLRIVDLLKITKSKKKSAILLETLTRIIEMKSLELPLMNVPPIGFQTEEE